MAIELQSLIKTAWPFDLVDEAPVEYLVQCRKHFHSRYWHPVQTAPRSFLRASSGTKIPLNPGNQLNPHSNTNCYMQTFMLDARKGGPNLKRKKRSMHERSSRERKRSKAKAHNLISLIIIVRICHHHIITISMGKWTSSSSQVVLARSPAFAASRDGGSGGSDKASCSTSLKAAKSSSCLKSCALSKSHWDGKILDTIKSKWSLSINNHDSSVQVIVSKEVEWFQNGDTTVTWLISILIFIWYTNFCISVGTSELSFCSTRWSRHFRGRRGPVLAPRRWIT